MQADLLSVLMIMKVAEFFITAYFSNTDADLCQDVLRLL